MKNSYRTHQNTADTGLSIPEKKKSITENLNTSARTSSAQVSDSDELEEENVKTSH